MELRERILEESAHLFFGRGIKSVTMNDVANHLGISKRTLYEVFKDKNELVTECVVRILSESQEKAMEHFDKHENVIQGFLAMYEEHLKNISKVNRTAIRDIIKYYPQVYKIAQSNAAAIGKIYESVLQKGIDMGYIRKDINVEIVVELFQSQIRMVMEDDYFLYIKYPLAEYMENIIMSFIRGISTELGLSNIEYYINNREI